MALDSSTYPSPPPAIPRVLSIAGTDPSGGAGIHADLKAIEAAGGYGMAVITALVAQNTQGVRAIEVPPVPFLAAQLAAVADDITIDAIKIGMVATAEVATAVAQWLADYRAKHPHVPVVLDPVMVATSSDRLLDSAAEEVVGRMAAHATVVTPNLPELAVLIGQPQRAAEFRSDLAAAVDAASTWAQRTGTAVIVKGGHLDSDRADNVVVEASGRTSTIAVPRVDTPHTHGTGCSLSSALATRLGGGEDLVSATAWASDWLHSAIYHAGLLQVGHGHGPVYHAARSRGLRP